MNIDKVAEAMVFEGNDTTTTGPWRFDLSWIHDDDSDPATDGDWATSGQIMAWHEGDWHYITLVVTCALLGSDNIVGTATLGGVTCGAADGDAQGAWRYNGPTMVHEAHQEALASAGRALQCIGQALAYTG